MPSVPDLPADLEETIRFHGHLCPGLVLGYRAAHEALRRLGGIRAEDEELVAIVENDACGVDAVQVLTGCTFGKGNLVFRDHGKHVYTLARRRDGKGVRLSARAGRRPAEPGDSKEERARRLLAVPVDELFDVRETVGSLPEPARIHESIACDACGEPTMATRLREVGGRRLCIPCEVSASSGRGA